jgi:hypothetical protein
LKRPRHWLFDAGSAGFREGQVTPLKENAGTQDFKPIAWRVVAQTVAKLHRVAEECTGKPHRILQK